MLLKEKKEIEAWLNQYKIKKYELIEDEKYGYIVNVKNNVDLYGLCLKEINVKFNEVYGDFDCGVNYLKNYDFLPCFVKNYLNLSFNLFKEFPEEAIKVGKGNKQKLKNLFIPINM